MTDQAGKPTITLHCGDCLEYMKSMPDGSFDSLVTDPPYGWHFMGKKWDYDIPSVEVWRECLRVLKPGAHALVACGTRTQHRMAVNLEDAGFEIRDLIAWVYGSGFPKSLDISKAIDKQAGAVREIVCIKRKYHIGGKNANEGWRRPSHYNKDGSPKTTQEITAPHTSKAKIWQGWGTALKPAMELWTLCRKPLSEKTVAENVLKYGTGGLNIDGCRIATNELTPRNNKIGDNGWKNSSGGYIEPSPLGRFPANFIHDGSDEVMGLFPETASGKMPAGQKRFNSASPNRNTFGYMAPDVTKFDTPADSGSAARFFYTAKASKGERNAGLTGFEEKRPDERTKTGMGTFDEKGVARQKNHHPTVKPVALMRYLCRMITPPKGTVLDCYMGSGSTGIAAGEEGLNFCGIEIGPEYFAIAKRRIDSTEWGLFE